MGFLMSEWDEKLLKYGELFETKLMDLSVNIPLEDALDLGWEILAECFEPNETGLKTSLLQERCRISGIKIKGAANGYQTY